MPYVFAVFAVHSQQSGLSGLRPDLSTFSQKRSSSGIGFLPAMPLLYRTGTRCAIVNLYVSIKRFLQ